MAMTQYVFLAYGITGTLLVILVVTTLLRARRVNMLVKPSTKP